MPAHILEKVFGLDRDVTIQRAFHNAIVTDSIVAVQAYASEMDNLGIAGRGGLNIKRTSLRIAAQNPSDAFFVGAGGINCGGMNGIARPDGEHWLIQRRELAIENCGRKFMMLRRTGAAMRNQLGREIVCDRMRKITAVNKNSRASHGVTLHSGFAVLAAAFPIFCEKMKRVAGQSAFQFVAAQVAGEFVTLLLQDRKS